MQLFIEAEPPTEPQAISQRMSELSVRMARSGYLLSKAKYEQELAMLKASRLKDLIPLAEYPKRNTSGVLCRGEQGR